MANPGGNYPGRQIFLGTLKTGEPAFAYFGSGRSSGSQGRYATPFIEGENAIRIKPTNPNEKYDPFRHYQAVRIDPESGLLVVSNSQAPNDATFEAYKFMPDVDKMGSEFLERLLEVIGPEYDSKEKPTSRVVGVISVADKIRLPILGITTERNSAHAMAVPAPHGGLVYVQTYNGDVDYKNFDPNILSDGKALFETGAKNAEELANEIYEISDYIDPKYGELRVWCVAGVQNGNGPGGWDIFRKNRHNVE